MDDPRLGSALKSIRLRAGLTQEEVAVAAGVPRSLVGRIERGRIAVVRFGDLRSVAAVLDTSVDLIVRWHGGDLGRVINARHAAIHEAGARRFAALEEWVLEPEVSCSSYGARGVIDGLAWHAASRSLLVIELKSEIVDINNLMGSVDRKRRLAAEIGRSRDGTPRACRRGSWSPTAGRTGGCWLGMRAPCDSSFRRTATRSRRGFGGRREPSMHWASCQLSRWRSAVPASPGRDTSGVRGCRCRSQMPLPDDDRDKQ